MPANRANCLTKDTEVERAFVRTKLIGKADRAACKYCKDSPDAYERSWNTTLLRDHLVLCNPYQDMLKETVKDYQKRPRSMTMRIELEEEKAGKRSKPSSDPPRPSNPFTNRSKGTNYRVDMLFTRAIFASTCTIFYV